MRFNKELAPKAPNANTPNVEVGSGTEVSLTLSTNSPESTIVSVTSVTPSPKTYVPVVGIVKEKVRNPVSSLNGVGELRNIGNLVSASSDKRPRETKEKSLKGFDGSVNSFVRKFQSKVKMSPALPVNVCRIAEPEVALPLPRLSRLPGANPRNASREKSVTVASAVDTKAWKVPSVGPLPNADVRILALPVVVHPVKLPVSKPPFTSCAEAGWTAAIALSEIEQAVPRARTETDFMM